MRDVTLKEEKLHLTVILLIVYCFTNMFLYTINKRLLQLTNENKIEILQLQTANTNTKPCKESTLKFIFIISDSKIFCFSGITI